MATVISTIDIKNVNFTMMNILRIMFSINGVQYKLEYPKILNEDVFRTIVYGYISYHTTIH